MKHLSLTLLQRGVIQRLREAGFDEAASAARSAWSSGEHCRGHAAVIIAVEADAELRADFFRANEQAIESP